MSGIQWTFLAKMERKGGIEGSKLLPASEISGFIHSLRAADVRTQQAKVDQPRAGRYGGDCELHDRGNLMTNLSGLKRKDIDTLETPILLSRHMPKSPIRSTTKLIHPLTHWLGGTLQTYIHLILHNPKKLPGLFCTGGGDLAAPIAKLSTTLKAVLEIIDGVSEMEKSIAPNLGVAENELDLDFLNWTDRRKIDKEPELEPLIAEGMRNISPNEPRNSANLRQPLYLNSNGWIGSTLEMVGCAESVGGHQ